MDRRHLRPVDEPQPVELLVEDHGECRHDVGVLADQAVRGRQEHVRRNHLGGAQRDGAAAERSLHQQHDRAVGRVGGAADDRRLRFIDRDRRHSPPRRTPPPSPPSARGRASAASELERSRDSAAVGGRDGSDAQRLLEQLRRRVPLRAYARARRLTVPHDVPESHPAGGQHARHHPQRRCGVGEAGAAVAVALVLLRAKARSGPIGTEQLKAAETLLVLPGLAFCAAAMIVVRQSISRLL